VGYAAVLALLAGCGSSPPVPADRFYHLGAIEAPSGAPLTDGAIVVRSFNADGVHGERAILYSDDAATLELQQHHYAFWTEPPPRMLQSALIDRLRAAGGAALVTDDAKIDAALTVRGRIRRFERQLAGDPAVVVQLELRLDDASGRPLLVKDYAARTPVADEKVPAAVDGFTTALRTVFDEFLADARAVTRAVP
jgi:ABC-type uncharacterized transport system auxiliary subunit